MHGFYRVLNVVTLAATNEQDKDKNDENDKTQVNDEEIHTDNASLRIKHSGYPIKSPSNFPKQIGKPVLRGELDKLHRPQT
jgi:hypothetical protein